MGYAHPPSRLFCQKRYAWQQRAKERWNWKNLQSVKSWFYVTWPWGGEKEIAYLLGINYKIVNDFKISAMIENWHKKKCPHSLSGWELLKQHMLSLRVNIKIPANSVVSKIGSVALRRCQVTCCFFCDVTWRCLWSEKPSNACIILSILWLSVFAGTSPIHWASAISKR